MGRDSAYRPGRCGRRGFNPRRRRERNPRFERAVRVSPSFQSMPPRGKGLVSFGTSAQVRLFQLTPPVGRIVVRDETYQLHLVSIHARVWERISALLGRVLTQVFQSTSPCGGEPAQATASTAIGVVSIHAPKVAGCGVAVQHAAVDDVSIHAPMWGQQRQRHHLCSEHAVSIQPRGGANGCCRPSSCRHSHFNPYPRSGANTAVHVKDLVYCQSQSTRPCRANQTFSRTNSTLCLFQPTSRVGANHIGGVGLEVCRVSIHALMRGKTVALVDPVDTVVVLIHAPDASETGGDRVGSHRGWVSIHAPVGARRCRSRRHRLPAAVSIHAPVWERTCRATAASGLRPGFNPFPPCGGRMRPNYTAVGLVRVSSTPRVWATLAVPDVKASPP